MRDSKIIFGIDISKDTFDVMDSSGNHYQFLNKAVGFSEFLKLLNRHSHCVMEATGYYHYRLAYFLKNHNIAVSVENPLSIKRFIQMKLSRIKTDKSDAKMICFYGQERDLKLWTGYSKHQLQCLQSLCLVDFYIKQCTALKNKIQAEEVLGNPCKPVLRSLNRCLRNIRKEKLFVENSLTAMIDDEYWELITKLQTIPGIGPRTAFMLVVQTDGFKRFETSGQLCSYCGLTPVIRQSGSSFRGRTRISKMGNSKLRNLLFLCSFTACRSNKACNNLYERLINKGKSKKLALIAVCNKLLKQAFAIAKSGIVFNENHDEGKVSG